MNCHDMILSDVRTDETQAEKSIMVVGCVVSSCVAATAKANIIGQIDRTSSPLARRDHSACMIATQHKTAIAVKALAVLPASTAGPVRPRARSQAERGQACELGIGVYS